ncbi:hypothetical protein EOA79_01465 [Mesorhizobium sp. M1A.F.Ca.IN.020.03.2.1]|uniref:hypothetical protein n=1 Tax=Mesorhizobium sp. M1A.F.Ca.IN.020.03.2.1 TaxID=2496769 RepID=UPI000FD5E202|nr:hypothetical protein [Mesorhizobium sp. M1A.F.Ca.IN.020.03.2.1]RUV08164.1 hypothetical protein EOA79_01465 [Mesorhizobium sp. M1A.F.Ca.IN.020.03.2.1]
MADLQIGDVVTVAIGPMWTTYAVSGFIEDRQRVKLVRKNSSGTYSSILSDPKRVRQISRPAFKSGDKVLVDGFKGEFMSFERGGDVARVMLAPRRRQFTGVGFIDISHAVVRLNYWMLVIENSKRLMEK